MTECTKCGSPTEGDTRKRSILLPNGTVAEWCGFCEDDHDQVLAILLPMVMFG